MWREPGNAVATEAGDENRGGCEDQEGEGTEDRCRPCRCQLSSNSERRRVERLYAPCAIKMLRLAPPPELPASESFGPAAPATRAERTTGMVRFSEIEPFGYEDKLVSHGGRAFGGKTYLVVLGKAGGLATTARVLAPRCVDHLRLIRGERSLHARLARVTRRRIKNAQECDCSVGRRGVHGRKGGDKLVVRLGVCTGCRRRELRHVVRRVAGNTMRQRPVGGRSGNVRPSDDVVGATHKLRGPHGVSEAVSD